MQNNKICKKTNGELRGVFPCENQCSIIRPKKMKSNRNIHSKDGLLFKICALSLGLFTQPCLLAPRSLVLSTDSTWLKPKRLRKGNISLYLSYIHCDSYKCSNTENSRCHILDFQHKSLLFC